ncbi:uncharacterized protein Z520_01411 [Fonsecaea multimorphosa CBS 102226]|uniref:Tetrapyrrole biosynthesis uroporphyrinogen III synthase domain-containing protein n=1 Tax=Fonsecaea multimorphosa CBS 102226 TaxID=1442371 RepID=A0A0D2HM61_9EURO|nr:uncharacterized protein Z520_01411 [Fonsecaea multimorphosa CBS 102226]KIY02946.1 hypothetical protein Z520_01411 [Fonsecaea multimorphosa CBS 102226]OAL30778.1 hypothetical protein AYO22_01398 [Fonsecaea multimorphosa]
MTTSLTIPVLLLKTRSQPHDAYEEFFGPSSPFCRSGRGSASGATTENNADSASPVFLPEFVPVLDHRANTQNLGALEELLKSGRLSEQYGGMIFTSQRAVEAWADVVKRVEGGPGTERQGEEDVNHGRGGGVSASSPDLGHRYGIVPQTPNTDDDDGATPPLGNLLDDDFAFPLYTVGPATSRALNTLVTESLAASKHSHSPFSRLRPSVLGEHTGNGDKLAQYILSHYNALHSRRLYTFYDAPRLPFTPVMGPMPPRGERVDKDDARLRKKPLLFLVGEQRRDVIPKTLMDKEGKLASPEERIQVDELEVYTTVVMESFQDDFRRRIAEHKLGGVRVVVVVVFSPQGCESMLRSLDYIDNNHALTDRARTRWVETDNVEDDHEQTSRYIIVTIGPTTRDHLRNKYGFEADVCSAKPSPEGVGRGLMEFLEQKGVL